MSRRWLTGAILFSLGFGCAKLVTLPAAGAASTDGVVDGTLEYTDGDENFELIYPPGGKTDYLAVALRKSAPGTMSAPQISYDTGTAVIAKGDLKRLTVFRLTPLIVWEGRTIRCDPEGPVLCPLPPPPPPPEYLHYRFLKSEAQ